MSKKERKTVTLDPDIVKDLKRLAEEEGRSFSSIAEKMIREKRREIKENPKRELLKEKNNIEEKVGELLEERVEIVDKLTNDFKLDFGEDHFLQEWKKKSEKTMKENRKNHEKEEGDS